MEKSRKLLSGGGAGIRISLVENFPKTIQREETSITDQRVFPLFVETSFLEILLAILNIFLTKPTIFPSYSKNFITKAHYFLCILKVFTKSQYFLDILKVYFIKLQHFVDILKKFLYEIARFP